MVATINIPWSSSGSKLEGTILNRPTAPPQMSSKANTAAGMRRIKKPAQPVYVLVTLANHWSNLKKNPLVRGFISFSNSAHNAGVSVKATRPEITTDTAMVMANCWYITPVKPPMNATGTNTEHSTSTMATTGPVTSSIALIVASLTGKCSSCMIRSTFSMTTMASSTTIPIANTRPNNVSVLMENPSSNIPANAPTIDTGTARHGINVARQSCRNRYMTRNTKIMASMRV